MIETDSRRGQLIVVDEELAQAASLSQTLLAEEQQVVAFTHSAEALATLAVKRCIVLLAELLAVSTDVLDADNSLGTAPPRPADPRSWAKPATVGAMGAMGAMGAS